MKTENNAYIKEIRGALGLEETDTSKDLEIENMPPFERVQLIAQWELGDKIWAKLFYRWCDSQGLRITEQNF